MPLFVLLIYAFCRPQDGNEEKETSLLATVRCCFFQQSSGCDNFYLLENGKRTLENTETLSIHKI